MSAYVLRTCKADLTSHEGFQWPESGPVEAPDWDPKPECGGGLHGMLWGEGDGNLLDWHDDARWLVVEVDESECIDLHGKVKFPRGSVVHCGDRLGATTDIIARGARGAVIGANVVAGYHGTATAGHHGTATAGHHGTATAGYHGTATAGYHGTATAGDYGTATAGDYGTATAGDGGTATAGKDGSIVIKRLDGHRFRLVVGYVGEDGIEPNVAYKLDPDGKFVRSDGGAA